MRSSEIYKELITLISSFMKEKGFSRKGNCFYIRQGKNFGMLDFQKSRKSNANEVIFTINIGICSGQLLDFFSPELIDHKPSIEICHWRERLGFLLPDRQDKWWVIRTSEPLKPLVDELKFCLSEIVFPVVGRYLSDEQLSREWSSGRSPGLTDIQRLMHLSVLLKEAGKDSDLIKVLSELEEKSAGKSTEVMVKMHLQHLSILGKK